MKRILFASIALLAVSSSAALAQTSMTIVGPFTFKHTSTGCTISGITQIDVVGNKVTAKGTPVFSGCPKVTLQSPLPPVPLPKYLSLYAASPVPIGLALPQP